MTPFEALKREVEIELNDTLRRLDSGPHPASIPDAITIRIEFDRETGMPRRVDLHEERSRRIHGGAIASSKRCGSAA